MEMGEKIKARILVAVALIALLVPIVWTFVTYEKVAYAIIVAVFGFVGFYVSELAKGVVRAKHAANHAWAYITNIHYGNELDTTISLFSPLVKDWQRARNEYFEKLSPDAKRNIDYTNVDKEFRDKIKGDVSQPAYLSARAAHLENQKKLPGKVEAMLKEMESVIEQTNESYKYMPDQDVALLGPEILLYAVSARAAFRSFLQGSYSLLLYVKSTPAVQPQEIVNDLQRIVFHLVKTQLELAMLRPLVERARTKNIFEITMALLR